MITARLQKAIDTSRGGRRLVAAVRAVNVGTLRRRTGYAHWTDVFGIVTMASLAVLFVTGVVLMFFYVPSSARVVYDGGYAPLHGTEMSKALASTLGLSLDVPGGLLIRQAHHWAALLLPAAIIAQLVVAFFTGAFRGPRRWTWVLLFTTLIVALAAGWSGYALPDDMLSGTGLRIVEGIVLGIPVAGTWLAALFFGGGFPGRIIENLYPIHLLVSAALVGVIALRLRRSWRHGPLGFAGASRVAMPALLRRAALWFGMACGILIVVGATVTISPIWLYGPSDPANVSAGSQPDWYTGFLDGALRLVPPGWEVEAFGGTVSLAVVAPLAVIGAFLAAVLLYPFVEGRATRRRSARGRPARGQNVEFLDRPRSAPTRTAIGVAGMVFYAVLWGAASSDVLATQFRVSLESVIVGFQVLLIAGPLIASVLTRRICLGLQLKDREVVEHGYETGRIVRMPGGEYVEQHLPLDPARRRRLTGSPEVAGRIAG